MDRIAEGLGSLADSIISGIKDVLVAVFVPSEDYITDRWNSIRDRFGFAESIASTADIIFTFFKDTAFDVPPKVYLHLDHAESQYDYGGKSVCLDMSWYSRYKPTVDAFLSAWLWLVFSYRIYVRLPGTINGVGGDFQVAHDASESRDYIKWSLSQRKGGFK